MIKIYKIIFLLVALIFLTTFNPKQIDIKKNKEKTIFGIQDIEIKNNILIKKSDVLDLLSHIYGKNIFLIKKADIEKPLKKIDFLDKIEVKKKYPNAIILKIYETKPIAILFKNKIKFLIDSSSNLNSLNAYRDYRNLPEVFGDGAENNFINFYELLKKNDFPNEKIKSYYYFQIGRWDLQLIDNKIIKFPSNKTLEAIIKSVELLNREDFKIYNTIDLRVDGKIIVE